jgi:hypothetical protein
VDNKTEGVLNNLTAILVIFTALLDPRVSVGLAVVFLIALGMYHFMQHQDGKKSN